LESKITLIIIINFKKIIRYFFSMGRNNMPVFLLAAGESSRMFPISHNKHKTHIKLLGKSILQHVIESFVNNNFKDIFVISSPSHNLKKVLDNNILNKINIIYQEKPLGVGHALSLIKDYVSDLFFLANGYHLMTNHLKEILMNIKEETLFVKGTNEPEKYGMVKVKDNVIIDIVEKPSKWDEHPLRVIGFYILSKDFLNRYLLKEEIHKNHYSFEESIKKKAMREGISFVKYEFETPSLKYPWDYVKYFEYLISHLYPSNKIYLLENAEISEYAYLDTKNGAIIIDNNAKIKEGAIIRGPAYIGKNTIIGNHTLIRNSNIENDSLIGYNSEIVRSILQGNAKIHAGYIGDSIIDRDFRCGFGFVTANRRLDNKKIKVMIKNKLTEYNGKGLGIICGENVAIGSNSTSMPGTIIMPNTIIYPNVRFKGVVEGIVKTNNF